LTPHAVVAQRVEGAVNRIDTCLNAAQLRGDLAFFNQAYKAKHAAAQARGSGFMSYVANAIANGGTISRPLMLSVFGE
jgi:hypothetical protein